MDNQSFQSGQVAGLTGVANITAGEFNSLASKSDGTIWIWGWGGHSQLAYDAHPNPTQIAGLDGVTVAAGGYYHSLALRSGDGNTLTMTVARTDCGDVTPAAVLTAIPRALQSILLPHRRQAGGFLAGTAMSPVPLRLIPP